MNVRAINNYLYIIPLLLIYPLGTLFAQDTIPKNIIYLEGGGVGVLYSLNYERIISDNLSIRIGYTSWTMGIYGGSDSFTGIPLLVNYFLYEGNNKVEFGVGLEYARTNESDYRHTIIAVGTIGYRYQPKDGGFHFRIGVVPIIGFGKFSVIFGISMGFYF
jgi:hypothetical protein